MIYLDKNYIRMLGSIPQALTACASFREYTKAVQLWGENVTVARETQATIRGGADILMVDTGAREGLKCYLSELAAMGCRRHVKMTFAGDVELTDIPELSKRTDILCIGEEIVDAPLLDWKLDVMRGKC